MTKWEFLFMNSMFMNGEWRPYSINGKRIPDAENGPNIYDVANQLGGQGWELLSTEYVMQPNQGNEYLLVYKRTKD